MRELELLAPARNADIGIAAIDCGADAVYIGGPAFGARKDAGNSLEEIARLCSHARKYGARVFITANTTLRAGEEAILRPMLEEACSAGIDAVIMRDPRILQWGLGVPMHASTQCAIRDADAARRYEDMGCSRIILERELSLEQIRKICEAVSCEVEAFVHGALCVCYSGECRLSEFIDGRSADRGECIQACRSRYDLTDASGRILLKDKAILSLKDLDLHERLGDLIQAGVSSFKIEGRLKPESYVRNLCLYYNGLLDCIVAKDTQQLQRASFGKTDSGSFRPDPLKTFNRGYTQLFLDGKRQRGWSSMDAPKHLGEPVGTVESIKRGPVSTRIKLKLIGGIVLHNGDGLGFISPKGGVDGFRADVCEGSSVLCRDAGTVREGMQVFRNIDSSFEKALEGANIRREIAVRLSVEVSRRGKLEIVARSEDGREVRSTFHSDVDTAENRERQEALMRGQLSKRALHYKFELEEIQPAGCPLPLLSAATLNSMRRLVAEDLDSLPCHKRAMLTRMPGVSPSCPAPTGNLPLMRSKYCIRFELGLCPVHQKAARDNSDLFLLNNGRKFTAHFDCAHCEMTIS
ncbi:MAG: U32 family peptidase [Bacteroidales bacterium]|nr:U32 family peptidase [Bacteroidales bacterium]